MIQRFSFGHPFPTQSVVLSLPAESSPVPFLTPDGTGWRFTLSEQAAVYGLGEMPRGINKRGWHYIANNTDESRHSEDKLSFYGAHNFLLVRDGSTCFGLFVDFPGGLPLVGIFFPDHTVQQRFQHFADARPRRDACRHQVAAIHSQLADAAAYAVRIQSFGQFGKCSKISRVFRPSVRSSRYSLRMMSS